MIIFVLLVIIFLPLPALAYVGPGLGLGMIGAALGFLFSVVLVLFGIIWFPVKRIIKYIRKKKKDD